jgi:surface protein
VSLHDQEWGDGHRDRVTVYTQATHRYKSQGEYTITIRGIIVGWRFGEIDSFVDRSGGCRNNLLNIAQWGCLRLGNKGAYFAGCEKFRCNAKDALDLKDTTNLASMFRGASSFTSDLSAWQTGQVTDMSGMFYDASSFTSDLSAWQTGQVTNMSYMFFGACSFDGDVSCWGDHPEVARFLFSDSDYELRLLERKANAPRFQARALKNRNLMRNSIRLRQVLCVCI